VEWKAITEEHQKKRGPLHEIEGVKPRGKERWAEQGGPDSRDSGGAAIGKKQGILCPKKKEGKKGGSVKFLTSRDTHCQKQKGESLLGPDKKHDRKAEHVRRQGKRKVLWKVRLG